MDEAALKTQINTKDVAIFGGTGFIGRSLIKRLAAAGARIRIPTRNLAAALPLKTAGVVGQIVPLRVDLSNDADLKAVVAGCHSVVYLPGLLTEQAASFADIHTAVPARLAALCAESDVKTFVFMSALGAHLSSPSAYARTKAEGEAKVQSAFAGASVVRPSVVFGPGDSFFNLFGRMAMMSPFLPLVGRGVSKLQPVYVGNVADAISLLVSGLANPGKIWHLGGPEVVSLRQIMELVCIYSQRKRILLPLPWSVTKIMANITEALPLVPAPITSDQIALLQEDNVVPRQALDLTALGLASTAMEAILPSYMEVWSPHGRYKAAS